MGKKGQLLFKGDKRPKKKSKKTKAEKKSCPSPAEEQRQHEAAWKDAKAPSKASTTNTPSVQTGTGKITTSGTVVTGHATVFQKELDVGDAVLVGDEMRVVTMRLSNTSVNLSSAFSNNLSHPTKFQYVKKPKNQKAEESEQRRKQKEHADAVEKNAFDIYSSGGGGGSGSNNTFTYREKTETGSYRVKQAMSSSSSSSTRTDLLALRSKKTSDKYC